MRQRQQRKRNGQMHASVEPGMSTAQALHHLENCLAAAQSLWV